MHWTKFDHFIDTVRKMENLFEHVPVAVGMIDMPSFKFVATTSSYKKLLKSRLGYDDVIGKRLQDVMLQPDPHAVYSLIAAHETSRVARFAALESKALDGKVSFWSGASFPILCGEKRTIVLGLLLDITDEIKGRCELRPARDIQRIDNFIQVAIRELHSAGQGQKMLNLLGETVSHSA